MTERRPSCQRHLDLLEQAMIGFRAQAEVAELWGAELAAVMTRGGRLLTAGNGGSAAEAQHLTAELVGRFQRERRPFSAICLSAETSSLTAIVNDYAPEELFARQVQAHGRTGDVLVLFSTSGRSSNVIAAGERGRSSGLRVLAFTGPPPNPLADVADDALCVQAASTATVQEFHLVALHIMCAAFDAALPEPGDVDADRRTDLRKDPGGHHAIAIRVAT